MRMFLVSYDLNRPGQQYASLINRLEQLGARRVLYSQWMLRTATPVEALRNDLQRFLDAGDGILVVDVTNAPMAWSNLQSEIKTTFNLT